MRQTEWNLLLVSSAHSFPKLELDEWRMAPRIYLADLMSFEAHHDPCLRLRRNDVPPSRTLRRLTARFGLSLLCSLDISSSVPHDTSESDVAR